MKYGSFNLVVGDGELMFTVQGNGEPDSRVYLTVEAIGSDGSKASIVLNDQQVEDLTSLLDRAAHQRKALTYWRRTHLDPEPQVLIANPAETGVDSTPTLHESEDVSSEESA